MSVNRSHWPRLAVTGIVEWCPNKTLFSSNLTKKAMSFLSFSPFLCVWVCSRCILECLFRKWIFFPLCLELCMCVVVCPLRLCGFVIIMQICDTSSFWSAKSYQSVCTFISQLHDDMGCLRSVLRAVFHSSYSISYSVLLFSALFLPCCLLVDACFVVLSRSRLAQWLLLLLLFGPLCCLLFASSAHSSCSSSRLTTAPFCHNTFPFHSDLIFLSPFLSVFFFVSPENGKGNDETMKD